MTCENACPNQADYTLCRTGSKPISLCKAHVYTYKATLNADQYIVRPVSLEAHIEDYKKKSGKA